MSVKKNVDCRYIVSVQYITNEQSLVNKNKLVIRVAMTIIKHNLIIGIPVVQSLVCSVL